MKNIFYLLLTLFVLSNKVFSEPIFQQIEIPLKKELTRREKRQQKDEFSNNIISELLEENIELTENIERKLKREKFRRRQPKGNRFVNLLNDKIFRIFSSAEKKSKERKIPEVRIEPKDNSKRKVFQLRLKPLVRERKKSNWRKAFRKKNQRVINGTKKKNDRVNVSSLKENLEVMLPNTPYSMIEGYDKDWMRKHTAKSTETSLLVLAMDEYNQQQVSVWIKFTSYKGIMKINEDTPFLYHESGDVHLFEKGQIIEYSVFPNGDFCSQKGFVYLDKNHQVLRISLKRWVDSSEWSWFPLSLYRKIELKSEKKGSDIIDIRKNFKSSGFAGVGVMHPLVFLNKKSESVIKLPYDVLWEMCMSEKDKTSTWLPIQQIQVGSITMDIIGADERIVVEGDSEYEQLESIILKAKKSDALVCMGNISKTVLMGNVRVSPLSFLMYSNMVPGMVRLNNKEDLKIFHYLQKKGFSVSGVKPLLKNSNSFEGANHLVYLKNKEVSRKNILMSLKKGAVVMSGEARVKFYLTDGSGAKWEVGERVIASGHGSVFEPRVEFISRQGEEFAYRKAELILNGKIMQPTKFKMGLRSGSAVFGKMLLHPGDYIMLRMKGLKNREVLTNPIYIKKESTKSIRRKLIQVKLRTQDKGDKKSLFKVIVKAKKFYKRFRGVLGEDKLLSLPLNSKIEVWNESFQFRKIDLFEIVSEYLIRGESEVIGLKEGLEKLEKSKEFIIPVSFENDP